MNLYSKQISLALSCCVAFYRLVEVQRFLRLESIATDAFPSCSGTSNLPYRSDIAMHSARHFWVHPCLYRGCCECCGIRRRVRVCAHENFDTNKRSGDFTRNKPKRYTEIRISSKHKARLATHIPRYNNNRQKKQHSSTRTFLNRHQDLIRAVP